MSFLQSLFRTKFTIKKTVYSTTAGKQTKVLSTVSTKNLGRFEPLRGDMPKTFVGSVKNATHRLFTNVNSDIEPGVYITREDTSVQFDVVSVGEQDYYDQDHHMEILLDERSKDAS